jgi:hypothetical protein
MRHRATHEALNVAAAFNWMAVIEKYDLSLDVDIKRKFSTHVPMYVPIVALKHDWDWTILSERMCMKDVVAYHEVHAPLQWDILSVHISLSDVLENPDLPWHYSSLSARLDLHPEFVNSLSDKPWPSYVKRWALSPPVPLSIEPIQADLVYEPGIAEWMSKFCVDIDFVRKHIDADWNFSALSKSNTKLAIELSIEFPEKAWDFNTISWGLKSVDPVMRQRVFEFAVANPNIAYTTGVSFHAPKCFILANPDYNWCKHAMSLSEPKFTTHYYSDYEDDIRVHAVVQIQSMFRRYKAMRRVAVLRIEKAFIRATYDPNYVLCRRKMKRCANEYGTIDSDERVQKKRKISLHWDGQDIVPH